MTTERLFYGVPFPVEIAHRLERIVSATPDIADRAGPSANWHVTLRFLGSTDTTRRQAITEAVDAAPLPRAFRTRTSGWGAFPRAAAAKIFWIGLADPDGHLNTIVSTLEAAARAAGFTPEERPFRPHVTLARFRRPIDLKSTIDGLPVIRTSFLIDRFVLFRSTLGSGAPRYEPVEVHRLLPPQP